MLIALTALIIANPPDRCRLYADWRQGSTGAEILHYRKGILTIIITAFGAWVGAGAHISSAERICA
jgi:hypothetical protein